MLESLLKTEAGDTSAYRDVLAIFKLALPKHQVFKTNKVDHCLRLASFLDKNQSLHLRYGFEALLRKYFNVEETTSDSDEYSLSSIFQLANSAASIKTLMKAWLHQIEKAKVSQYLIAENPTSLLLGVCRLHHRCPLLPFDVAIRAALLEHFFQLSTHQTIESTNQLEGTSTHHTHPVHIHHTHANTRQMQSLHLRNAW